jgi:hypothetical protein
VNITYHLHRLYFTTEFVTTPFPHLTTTRGLVHWVVTGGSYVLAAIGFFMLYKMFLEADYDSRSLGAVVAVTGLPIMSDLRGL